MAHPSLSLRASVRLPWPRFQSLLIKPDVRISRIRLSGEIMPSRSKGPWPAATGERGRSHRVASVSGKRTYFPDLTLCLRQSHRRSRRTACRLTAL